MNKETARKIYKAKRSELSIEEIQTMSKAIAENFFTSDLWKACKVIHVFISIPDKAEVDTSLLIDFFLKQSPGIKLCTSIIGETDGELMHTFINAETTYKTNSWNIPEPVERDFLPENQIDLVLIPLLAFDSEGNRVGYGKGFYDRFLQKCRSDVVKVGLSLFEPTEDLIEAEDWDVALDWGVTLEQIWSFVR